MKRSEWLPLSPIAVVLLAMTLLLGYYYETTVPEATNDSSSSSSSVPHAGYHSTVASPLGLELRVDLNASIMTSGNAIGAEIALYNSLDRNLTVASNYQGESYISTWKNYDFFCGGSGDTLTSILGFAVFSGHVTANNLSQAGNPLELAPPVGVSCVTYPRPDSITFLPHNDAAVTFGPGNQAGTLRNFTMPVTTESCSRPSPGTFYCGEGKGLFGYWVTPGVNTFSEQDGEIGSQYFGFFPPGQYTLVVQDVWNQTAYAYFDVMSPT